VAGTVPALTGTLPAGEFSLPAWNLFGKCFAIIVVAEGVSHGKSISYDILN
jgi:hypothetical protein